MEQPRDVKFYVLVLSVLLLCQQLFLWSDGYAQPVAGQAIPTEEALRRAEVPWRDLRDLVVRVKGVPPEAAYAAKPGPVEGRKVGDRAEFFVADEANNRYFTVSTVLRLVTPHAYMYVADAVNVDQQRLEEAAAVFEKVYESDRRYFGPEPEVGLDGDPRVSIVHAFIPGLGGYFTSVDCYPRSVHQYSNERKAIYMNVQAAPAGSNEYYAILAHEFEHMIQWNTNRAEDSWVKEGSSEVATDAAGLRTGSGFAQSFTRNPDLQVNAWADEVADRIPHYGAAYLFISYVLERFGGYDAASDLLTGVTKGPDSFDRFLAGRGTGLGFEDVFRDWVVANYLDERGASDPRFRYSRLKVQAPSTERAAGTGGEWQERTVRQFAADYIELPGGWSSARVRIRGDQTTRVVAATAHSGRSFWWSNRGDLVDTRLTRVFDLRGLSKATLRFWAWYDLEKGYDYAYVMASRDGGLTWSTLPATSATPENPSGNNLGNGFTGVSGASGPIWVEQAADLTPYAGDVVLVRFEMVTDDAVNEPGFVVDDISVPEIGYSSDGESDGGWLETGFVRIDGELPQRFLVQLIKFGDGATVEQVPFTADGADIRIENADGKLEKAVIVVSGLTRHTTEPARYRYLVDTTP